MGTRRPKETQGGPRRHKEAKMTLEREKLEKVIEKKEGEL